MKLTHVYLIVENQDEAKKWYTEKLGWQVKNDAHFKDIRWLTMCLPGQDDLEIHLHGVMEDEADERLKKAGHIAGWVFETNDCIRDIEKMRKKGVRILMEPQSKPWGVQSAFEDLYGNQFIIVQPQVEDAGRSR